MTTARAAPRINETVFEVLQHNLKSGRLATGTVIRESDVARLLDVGRVPARAALQRLESSGALIRAAGRGFAVPGPAGAELPAIELEVSERHREDLGQRNWRQRVFEMAELEVAAAAVYGSFRIGEAALATHYGFSRSVARDLLGRLDRVGLATQQANGRWQVARMDAAEIRDHYAVRRALEPIALRDAAPLLERALLQAIGDRLTEAMGAPRKASAAQLVAFERDLHVEIVLKTPNRPMAEAIRRSQLPLISTHIAFVDTRSREVVEATLAEHLAVVEALLRGRVENAAALLDAHLAGAELTSLDRLRRLRKSSSASLPPFLTPL